MSYGLCSGGQSIIGALMFRPWEVWRHNSCLDMDLLIIKIQYRGPTYLKCKVRFVDRKGNFFDKGPSTVNIQRKHFEHWRLVK